MIQIKQSLPVMSLLHDQELVEVELHRPPLEGHSAAAVLHPRKSVFVSSTL